MHRLSAGNVAALPGQPAEDAEFIEMERKDNLRRVANELLLIERAKEWLLEGNDK